MLPTQSPPPQQDRPRITCVANQKGGVGKTTTVMNLAAVVHSAIADVGPIYDQLVNDEGDPESPILVVTTDPQESSNFWAEQLKKGSGLPFNYAEAYTLDRIAVLPHLTQYKHIFVDTPGSLEKQDTLQAVVAISDDVVVPMTPQILSFQPTATTIENVIKPSGKPYRVVINNWDPRDGVTNLEQTARFVAGNGWPLCRTPIRRYRLHEHAAANGMVVTQYRGRVAAEALGDFRGLALELGYGGQLATQPATFMTGV